MSSYQLMKVTFVMIRPNLMSMTPLFNGVDVCDNKTKQI